MKTIQAHNILVAGLLTSVLLFSGCLVADDQEAKTTSIQINVSDGGKPISQDLVGIFYEDLNYAADGGLYAELIQNRSFEYSATEQSSWGPLSFWNLIKNGEGQGHLSVGESRPVHKNNPHYLILNVTEPSEGIGIMNKGFDSIPVKAGETYTASFWAYQAYMGLKWREDNSIKGRPMPVSLRLESEDGSILAESKLEFSGRDWQKITVELTPSRTDKNARFVLLAHAKGGLVLDMISLFPKNTFLNRENGLRKDLAQTIADLNPRFMRFPGGCLVHGTGVNHYYDWKDSVGPIEQRKAQRNSWGYHQTLGLGYFEYFQFCEDMNAIPIPVVSAGVCCQHAGDTPNGGQEGLPLEDMPAYIQDILDLIEWANAPADSEWGSVRAAAGHSEPFNLKYLGVGNEDAITPEFRERFKMILDVVREKHPEITVIGTSGPFASGEDYEKGWAFSRKLNLDLVDEHYYVSPQWFWDNLNRYDQYPRTGPKVYLGEYAAHEPDRRNTLRSALAEAAGLTALERNGDIVRFASYAPLFARRDHTQWTPDMIYFNDTDIFLTPNYYVQQLFGKNNGSHYLTTTISDKAETSKLAASTVRDQNSGDIIIKIVNGNNSPEQLSINLNGIPSGIRIHATKTILTGPTEDAVNTDGETLLIYPTSSKVELLPTFKYKAPANSLTVFRIRNQ